jgi:molybdate transport system substrate-binding protein
MSMRKIIATLGIGLPLMLGQTHAAEIKFLASNAIKAVLEEIAPQFEKASGHKLTITFGSTGNLTAAINKETPFDVAVLGADAVDSLIKQASSQGLGMTLCVPGSALRTARVRPNRT